MATIAEIKELALHAAKRTAPANYTTENVDSAVRDEFKGMCSSINEFRRNQYDIFQIIIEVADEVVPPRVMQRMGMFAEIKNVPQGAKAIFRKKAGKSRAKQFVTRVGLSGVYETFRLDAEEYEVVTRAVGSAGTIDFERFLDGIETMSDIMDVILEGLEDAAYKEVIGCLIASLNSTKRPAANKYIDNGFDAAHMAKLINTVKMYGDGAVLFAAPEFVLDMGPDAIVPAISNAAQGIYAPEDISDIHNIGHVRIFRGTPIVELPQGWVDESNTKTWVNPQFAFVFPAGKEKVVKFVFEGETQMWLRDNRDQSMEVNFYKKMGAAIHTFNNWGIYQNSSLTDTSL